MMQEQSNILISLRLKPTLNDQRFIQKLDNKSIRTKNHNGASYYFNRVFGEDEDNNIIFQDFTIQLLQNFIQGCNTTLCAYGQTSSGKTYTMQGKQDVKGIIQLSLDYLFKNIPIGAQMQIQFIEIYNEKIFDLLENNRPVEYDKYYQKFIAKDIATIQEFDQNFKYGNQKRHWGSNNLNIDSSRSHSILKILLKKNNYCQNDNATILQFIDLAGSESVIDENKGIEKESININKSLSSFSTLIQQLFNQQKNNQKFYLNFRDSALTFQFKNSLNNDSLLGFIFTINQQGNHYIYSQKTLTFSQTVGSIKQLPQPEKNISTNLQNLTTSPLLQQIIGQQSQMLETISKQKSQLELQAIQLDQQAIQLDQQAIQLDQQAIRIIQLEQSQNDIMMTPLRIRDQNRQEDQSKQARQSQIQQKRSVLIQLIQEEEQQVSQLQEPQLQIQQEPQQEIQYFNIQNINHYKQQAETSIKEFSKNFMNSDQRCQRKMLLLISDETESSIIRDKIIELFNFQIQSIILFQYLNKQYYIFLQLWQRTSIYPRNFNRQNQNLLFLNYAIDIQDLKFLINNLTIRYQLQDSTDQGLQQSQLYKQSLIATKTIQFHYQKISEMNLELIKQRIVNLDFDASNILNIDGDNLRFVVSFKQIQKMIIVGYFCTFHRPKITLIDERHSFEQIKYFYYTIHHGQYYTVQNRKLTQFYIQNTNIGFIDIEVDSKQFEF